MAYIPLAYGFGIWYYSTMFNRNYIVSIAMSILALIAFVFKEAASSFIGKFAEKLIRPEYLQGDLSMTLSPADILIILLLIVALLGFFWPILSKVFSTDLSRKKVVINETRKIIVSNYTFTSKREIDSLGDNTYSFIFVDCNFHLDRLALYGFEATGTYNFSSKTGVIATREQLDNLFDKKNKDIICLDIPLLINCRVKVREIIGEKQLVEDAWGVRESRIRDYSD